MALDKMFIALVVVYCNVCLASERDNLTSDARHITISRDDADNHTVCYGRMVDMVQAALREGSYLTANIAVEALDVAD